MECRPRPPSHHENRGGLSRPVCDDIRHAIEETLEDARTRLFDEVDSLERSMAIPAGLLSPNRHRLHSRQPTEPAQDPAPVEPPRLLQVPQVYKPDVQKGVAHKAQDFISFDEGGCQMFVSPSESYEPAPEISFAASCGLKLPATAESKEKATAGAVRGQTAVAVRPKSIGGACYSSKSREGANLGQMLGGWLPEKMTRLLSNVSKTGSLTPERAGSISSRDIARKIAKQMTKATSAAEIHGLQEPDSMWSPFELFFACMILTNAVMSGFEVQWAASHLGEDLPLEFVVVRHCYTLLFTLELLVRLWFVGPRKFFCSSNSHWSWLDLLVVLTGVLEMAVDIEWLLTKDRDNVAGSDVLRNVRLVRVLRVSRAFRLQRIIRFVAALRTLVYSIAVTLQSLFWAMVLLLMIIYVFGLAFTLEAVSHMSAAKQRGELDSVSPVLREVWGSVDGSMFALFQAISGGVSWRDVVDPLYDVSWFPVALFTCYVSVTYFAVLNVVTAVFCSSAIETTQRNPEIVAADRLTRRRSTYYHLKTLFAAIDVDDSGFLTLTELERISTDDTARAWFQALDIDFRDAWSLFKLLDSDKAGTIPIEDFLHGCEQLQGRASTIAIAEVKYDMRKMMTKMGSMMKEFEKNSSLAGQASNTLRPRSRKSTLASH